MVQKYITEIEELRAKLLESENLAEQLRKDSARIKRLSQINSSPLPASKTSTVFSPMTNNWTMDEDSGVSSSVQELIQLAKKDLEKNKEERKIFDKTMYFRGGRAGVSPSFSRNLPTFPEK